MEGLVKLAAPEHDAVRRLLQEEVDSNRQKHDSALAKRDPELVEKEERAYGYGIGGGLTGGGLLGAGTGAAYGIRNGLSGLGTLGTGAAGGVAGALGGAAIGGLAAMPFAAYQFSKNDPEVKDEIRQTRRDFSGTKERLSDYDKEREMMKQLIQERKEKEMAEWAERFKEARIGEGGLAKLADELSMADLYKSDPAFREISNKAYRENRLIDQYNGLMDKKQKDTVDTGTATGGIFGGFLGAGGGALGALRQTENMPRPKANKIGNLAAAGGAALGAVGGGFAGNQAAKRSTEYEQAEAAKERSKAIRQQSTQPMYDYYEEKTSGSAAGGLAKLATSGV